MDLLTTVRKEGSRGGRGDFKWSDVQSSGHRENYLGHSLMAPVGRWQNGRDLNWYARGDIDDARRGQDGSREESIEEKAARERREEIKRIKEAEQDALARALGYEVPSRIGRESVSDATSKTEIDRVVKEATAGESAGYRDVSAREKQQGAGIGYGKFEKPNAGDRSDGVEDCIQGMNSGGPGRDADTSSRRHRDDNGRPRERHRRHHEQCEHQHRRRDFPQSNHSSKRRRSRSSSIDDHRHHHRRHRRTQRRRRTSPGSRARSASRSPSRLRHPHRDHSSHSPNRHYSRSQFRSRSRSRSPPGDSGSSMSDHYSREISRLARHGHSDDRHHHHSLTDSHHSRRHHDHHHHHHHHHHHSRRQHRPRSQSRNK